MRGEHVDSLPASPVEPHTSGSAAGALATPSNGSAVDAGQEKVDSATYLEAIRYALEDELHSDDRVLLLGEDIGVMGGAFRVTEGLHERFGDSRVIDTPLAEIAIVGSGIGLAITGWRPVVEIQFADFVSCAYDQLVNEAAKLHYRFGIRVPLVVRLPSGGGLGAGPFHSQSPEGIFAHVPGLKLVCPGDVQDAYDLLRTSIRDPNPVLFFEQKGLYRSLRGPLVRRASQQYLSQGKIRRPGRDLSVITYGAMVPRCLTAAEHAAKEGVDVEVVDLRTLFPPDWPMVMDSVSRTSRALVVHEDTRSSGLGAEIAATIADRCLFQLDAPVIRVTAPDTPVPLTRALEDVFVPSVARITESILETARC